MKTYRKLIIVFLLGLIIRLLLTTSAHHGDLNNNISWGDESLKRGFVDFYEGKNWPYSAPNQPPLYILTFGITSLFFNVVSQTTSSLNRLVSFFPSSFVWFWEQNGLDITFKLPGIIADLGIGYLIYKFFNKKRQLGIKLSLLWLFNPVTIYSSSIWGQTDSVVNLLGLLSLVFLFKKRLELSAVFLVFCILFKPSLAIFIPVFALICFRQKYSLKSLIYTLVSSLIAIFVVSFWFHPKLDLLVWLFNLYTQRFLPGEIGYLTANAFNFWWLVNSGKVLDSSIFLGLQARLWGLLITISGMLLVLNRLLKNISERRVIFSLSLIACLSFIFLTRIHERYLYPFFPLGTLLLGFYPKLIGVYVFLSLLHLVNLYHLFWAPSIPFVEIFYKLNWLNIGNVISLLTLLSFIYLCFKFFQHRAGSVDY